MRAKLFLLPILLLVAGCDAQVYTLRPQVRIYDQTPPPSYVYHEPQPQPTVVQQVESPAGKTWVYYPDSNVYHCTNLGYYMVYRHGRWVTVHGRVPVSGPVVAVTYNGPRPYLYVDVHRGRHRRTHMELGTYHQPAGYSWVYYPQLNVYHCTNRNFYYRRSHGRWVRADRVRVHGPSVVVSYNGPQPFLYVDYHRRRRHRR